MREPDARFDGRIEEAMAPFAAAARRLRGIPGVGKQAAEGIVAGLGTDMTVFPSAGHLASWAGIGPGNDPSTGQQRNGKTTKGSQWLRWALVQAAWAARSTPETVFSTCFARWTQRLSRKKAVVAVAQQLLVVADHLLKKGTESRENSAAPKVA